MSEPQIAIEDALLEAEKMFKHSEVELPDRPLPLPDPRDRIRTPYHRVVAPNARTDGKRTFINGPLVVERSFKDSKGVEGWIVVKRWDSRPKASEDGELEVALYTLLSNGAE